MGQIFRGLATRKFLADFYPLRHRFIFGLNAMGAFLNIIAPFRGGDIFRLLILSRKKLGLTVAFYFIFVERIADLLIANSLFFSIALIEPSLQFSTINYLGWLFGLIGFLAIVGISRIAEFSRTPKNFRFLANSLRIVFSTRQYFLFSLSLLGGWVLTGCALLILASQNSTILQEWVSLNSSFSDPLSIVFTSFNYLFFALLIPLLLAFIYSFTIPSTRKIASKTFLKFSHDEFALFQINPFSSSFAGSGSELFLATRVQSDNDLSLNYLIRVEIDPEEQFNASEFIVGARPEFSFPHIYYQESAKNYRCTISELIVDATTGLPSQNVFEWMQHEKNNGGPEVLGRVTKLIHEFHSYPNSNTISLDEDLPKRVEERISRASAFIYLRLNQFKQLDRLRYGKFHEICNGLVGELDLLKSEFKVGECHGDASLTNFLVQDLGNRTKIRSIDPNPRFQISNIEYDLAKIMQSTHAMYEFYLEAPEKFPKNSHEFMLFQAQVGWAVHFQGSLGELNKIQKINYDLLRFFLLFHLIRIAPYKMQVDEQSFRRFLDLISWVDENVDF